MINAFRCAAGALAAVLATVPAHAFAQARGVTDIEIAYETGSQTFDKAMNDIGSSSSSGSTGYVETRIGETGDGIVLEYDLAEEERPLAEWQWPVRILDDRGSRSILNRAELEARRDRFLSEAKISSEACGTYYFTWNVFQVECEPDAVLETIAVLDIQPAALEDGAAITHPLADGDGMIRRVEQNGEGSEWRAVMTVDAATIREQRVQSERIIAEISGEGFDERAAIKAKSRDRIEGEIEIVLSADAVGVVRSRSETVTMQYVHASGEIERSTATRIISRRAR